MIYKNGIILKDLKADSSIKKIKTEVDLFLVKTI